MDEHIVKFIKKHHLLTLATTDDDGTPYCSNAFYAFDSDSGAFIFTAGDGTRHLEQMTARPAVAASVALETRIVGRIRGVQICGRVVAGSSADKALYLRRFPYAAAAGLREVWRLEPSFIKLTDNTLGFGKKIIWTKN